MKTIGLTGGIGMGKSASAQLLRDRHIPVIDTDDLARQVVEPGQPALDEIQRLFGPELIAPDGRLDRAELARRVFADPESRKRLEAILHPRIRELWQARIRDWSAEGHALAAVVIPLLFETAADRELDTVICVACSPRTQMDRLRSRGWSAEQIQQRIRAQWPTEKKMASANFVIWTEAALNVHAAQLDRILHLAPP
jgi:dephospho-CoA kinase